jgi:signal transduction histidine kinase
MVIDNLLSNAINYTPEGGRITVTIRASSASAFIDVADTGIGIAKQDLPMLFGKFNRLNAPASKTVGGSGLGLYIAKQIVDRHGGTISVRSAVGEGSAFTMRLPLFHRVR